MARKHKHPEHENLERWLVSYADFITLLFATFTALYALSQADLAKMKDVATAISQGFQEQSLMHGIKTVLQGKSPPNENPNPLSSEKGAGSGVIGQFESMTYKPGEVKAMEQTVKELRKDLDALNREISEQNARDALFTGTHPPGLEDSETPMRGVEVAVQERGLRISFDSRLLFEPGSASLKTSAESFLDGVAKRIKKYTSTHMLHVEGHTDDLPIATAIFPSNWELSAARASSVIRYFIRSHEFTPNALVAVGYGSTQPLTTNKTAEGRAQNRRVDIIIHSQRVSQELNPRVQFARETTLIKSVSNDGLSDEALKPATSTAGPSQDPGHPVRVIIKEPDGTEKVIVPQAKPIGPEPMGRADFNKH